MKSWQTKSGLRVLQILSGRSNVFILTNGHKNILIDTSPANKLKLLENRLKDNNIDHIDYLILTHSHFDHAGNAARLKNKFGCKVILHRSEDHNLRTGAISQPNGTNTFTRFIVKNLATKFSSRLKTEPCMPDILIDGKYGLRESGFNAYILHTPGHSPGSVSIIIDEEIALVGDTMFGVFKWSVFPPYAEDSDQLVKSWRSLLETNCQIFLPSHGGSKNRSQLLTEYQKRNGAIPD